MGFHAGGALRMDGAFSGLILEYSQVAGEGLLSSILGRLVTLGFDFFLTADITGGDGVDVGG